MSHGLGGKKRNLDRKTKVNNHERSLAKKLSGKRQLASGATAKEKGDVKTPDVLYDSKETVDSRITITAEILAKITYEARQVNRFPALVLTLETGSNVSKEWVLLTLDYHVRLQEGLLQLRNKIKQLEQGAIKCEESIYLESNSIG